MEAKVVNRVASFDVADVNPPGHGKSDVPTVGTEGYGPDALFATREDFADFGTRCGVDRTGVSYGAAVVNPPKAGQQELTVGTEC
jgi:hypothetical protein